MLLLTLLLLLILTVGLIVFGRTTSTEETFFEALDIQDELQTLYTSGTVFHAFLGEKLPDWKSAASLVRKISENYRLPYYTLSPTYSVCTEHGYIPGEVYECPICKKKTEVYSRITGYYRPVQNFNDGKAQEFSERKEYVIERSHLTHFGVLEHKEPEHNCECQPKAAANLLFTTKTCPNCKIAKALLEKAGIAYENIYANENEDMAKAYDIVTAPTLVVPDGDGVKRLKGVSEIRKYIESL